MGRAEDLFERLRADGERAIDALVADHQNENLFIDFKRSSDNGSGHTLHNKDRKNLAHAISGFGNSAGGLIVWGVGTPGRGSADIASAKCPLLDAERFVSLLESAVSGCTIPPHPGVQNATVLAYDGKPAFAVTLVPESFGGPHQVVPEKTYVIRAGSSFVPIDHAVLAGLFGRRPQPRILPEFRVHRHSLNRMSRGAEHYLCVCVIVTLVVKNDGPSVADTCFAVIHKRSKGGRNSNIFTKGISEEGWIYGNVEEETFSAVTRQGIRLPPSGRFNAVEIAFVLGPPFADLAIDLVTGCDGAPPISTELRRSAKDLHDEYQYLCECGPLRKSGADAMMLHERVRQMIGLTSDATVVFDDATMAL